MTEPTTSPPSSDNVYEMLWDCKYCGSRKLLGKTHRFCPVCGAAQDPEWRYFPSDEEKVAVHDHVYVGVDKLCPACGTAAAGNADFCARCGALLEGAEQVKIQAARERAEGEHFATEDLIARQDHEQDILLGRAQPQTTAKPKGRRPIVYAAIGGMVLLAVACVVVILLAIFWKRTETVTVAGHRWERVIEIETRQAISEHGDCDSLPGDAYDVNRRWEQVDTRRVPDGEECWMVQIDQGDGTGREERRCETKYRSEPVYGYVCYYQVNHWRKSREITAESSLQEAPYWPETGITGSCQVVGCEREGERREAYLLILENPGGDTYECPLPQGEWGAVSVGRPFTVKVGVIAGGADCDTLAHVGQG